MGFAAGVRLGGAALVALALVGVVPRARACILPPGGWTGGATSPIPANGVIPVTFACYTACGSEAPDPETFQLSDATGKVVPGTILLPSTSSMYVAFAFKPEVELAMGEYSVTLNSGLFAATVIAAQPSTWSAKPQLHEDPYRIEHGSGEPTCCEGTIGTCNQRPCFYDEIVRSTGARVLWTRDQPREAGQYAYRFVSPVGPASEWQLGDAANVPEMEGVTSYVCYMLELQRLTDGVLQSYEQRCVERPEDFGAAGVFPPDPDEVTFALRMCESPPPGEDAAWCSALAPLCSSNTTGTCATYARLCSTGGATSTGGAANGGAVNGGASSGGAGASDAGEPAVGDRFAKGCTCSMPGTASSRRASFILLALAAALLGAWRRRAARPV